MSTLLCCLSLSGSPSFRRPPDNPCTPAQTYLSAAPQAEPHAAGFSAGLSPAPHAEPHAAGFSDGLSPAPHAVPHAAAGAASLFHPDKLESAMSFYLLVCLCFLFLSFRQFHSNKTDRRKKVRTFLLDSYLLVTGKTTSEIIAFFSKIKSAKPLIVQ